VRPGPDPDVRAALRAAPKVELHLHLDGAMAIPWLLERVRRREAGVATPEALRARLAFRTLDEFTFFGASVLGELELCLTTLGFAPRDLAVLAEHAAGAAFLDAAPRERLRARVNAGWARLAGAS
jgi:adenosine deaminase